MGNNIQKECCGFDGDAVRLNKYISESGFCSRREADRLIADGKVTVDGRPAAVGMKVEKGQMVRVGTKTVGKRADMTVLAVYKPVGIICTEDSRIRQNIIRFLKYPKRVTYAGRLDKDSEGLLLMTNNGDLIHAMMRAANAHEKEYDVTVDKPVTAAFLQAMAAGVHITDEEKGLDAVTRPCKVVKKGRYQFTITLTQGLNRQIRRMTEAQGFHVTRLCRVRVLNIRLDGLKQGQYRKLTDRELNGLFEEIRSGDREKA